MTRLEELNEQIAIHEQRGPAGGELDALKAERETIKDAFLVTLFQILVDSPQMTATEVLERAREKGMLLAEQKPGSPAEVDEDTVGGKTIDETPAA